MIFFAPGEQHSRVRSLSSAVWRLRPPEAMGVHNEFVRDIYEFVTYISDLVAETLEDCANEVFFPSGNQYFCVSEQASERECAPTAVKQVSLNVVVVVGNGNNHGETGDPFSYSTYIYVLVYRRNCRL